MDWLIEEAEKSEGSTSESRPEDTISRRLTTQQMTSQQFESGTRLG